MSQSSFGIALSGVFASPYYLVLSRFMRLRRTEFPTSRRGLDFFDLPPALADFITSPELLGGCRPAVGIVAFVEELFALRGFTHRDHRVNEDYLRHAPLSPEALQALRGAVRERILAEWPEEARRQPSAFAKIYASRMEKLRLEARDEEARRRAAARRRAEEKRLACAA